MAIIARFIYRTELNQNTAEITDAAKSGPITDSLVENVATKIFKKLGFFGAIKKLAVKSILNREVSILNREVSIYKASEVPKLLRHTEELLTRDRINLVTPDALHKICFEARNTFSQFEVHEISYLIRQNAIFHSLDLYGMAPGKTQFAASKRMLAMSDAEQKRNNQDFDKLNTHLAAVLNISVEEIEREIYRQSFGLIPDTKTSADIHAELGSLSFDYRISKYKKMQAFAQVISISGTLSKRDADYLSECMFNQSHSIRAPLAKNMNGSLLDRMAQMAYLLPSLTLDVGNNVFYKDLSQKLFSSWQERFGDINRTVQTFKKLTVDDRRTFESAVDKSFDFLNETATAYIQHLLRTRPALRNKTPAQLFSIIKEGSSFFRELHPFSRVTMQQILTAKGLSSTREGTAPSNKAQLVGILHHIPTNSAIRISNWLKDQHEGKLEQSDLTPEEKKHVLSLFLAVGKCNTINCKAYLSWLDDLGNDKQLFPARPAHSDLDVDILKSIYKIKEKETMQDNQGATNALPFCALKIFEEYCLESLTQKMNPQDLSLAIEADTAVIDGKATLVLDRELETGLAKILKKHLPQLNDWQMTDAFAQEAARMPEMIINGRVFPTSPPLIEAEIPGSKERIQVPRLIAIMMDLKEIAKDDEKLFLQLQSISSQTLFNEVIRFYSENITKLLKLDRDLGEVGELLRMAPLPTKRILEVHPDHIKYVTESTLSIFYSNGKNEIRKFHKLTVEVNLIREGNNWAAQTPRIIVQPTNVTSVQYTNSVPTQEEVEPMSSDKEPIVEEVDDDVSYDSKHLQTSSETLSSTAVVA